jgi:hypothetical protein
MLRTGLAILAATLFLCWLYDNAAAKEAEATQEMKTVQFYDPLKGTQWEGLDYVPPMEQ